MIIAKEKKQYKLSYKDAELKYIKQGEKTVDNEKNEDLEMAVEAGKTVAGDTAARRPWHKPAVRRIDIKRTMNGSGPGFDGGTSHA